MEIVVTAITQQFDDRDLLGREARIFPIPMAASLGFGVLIGALLLMLVIPALTIVHVRITAVLAGSKDEDHAQKS